MQVPSLLALLLLIAPSQCKPAWSNLIADNYQYPVETFAAPTQHLQVSAYQDAPSPYYVYNVLQVHTDLRGVPAAILASGKPAVSQIPAFNYYFGTPVYDFRFPLNPVYPVLRPGLMPKPVPPTTERPYDDDDGIEKLDTKVDPENHKKPSITDSLEDDSITVEAI